MTHSRELTEDDVYWTRVVYAAVTAGSYQGGEFSFPIANLRPEIEAYVGKTANLRFEGKERTICKILDMNFDLGPCEIVATECTLSQGETDAGGRHLIVKPEPGSISVNFPQWQQRLSIKTNVTSTIP